MELLCVRSLLVVLTFACVKAATRDIYLSRHCTRPGNRVDISDATAGELIWDNFPSYTNCKVTLVAAVGKRIFLQFTDINIEAPNALWVKGGSYGGGIKPDQFWDMVTLTFHADYDARNRHVTLNLITNKVTSGKIRIRYTVYHSAHYDGCDGYTCRDRDMCIDDSLMCDGISHCGDDSDESSSSGGGCAEHREMVMIVGVGAGCVGGFFLLVLVIFMCCRGSKRPTTTTSAIPEPSSHPVQTSGAVSYPPPPGYSPPPSYDQVMKFPPPANISHSTTGSGSAVV